MKTTREQKNIIFAMGVLLLFLSAPLFMDYMPASDRLGIYFLEKKGIRGAFLWIPVLLCRVGMSIQGSIKLYMLLANLGALVVSLYSFRKITGSAYAGLAGSFCYSFSVYSVYIRYETGSLGEITAFVFLPLVVLGMYELYSADVVEKRYLRNGLWLFVGLWGVFLSHIPLAIVVSLFVVLGALVLYKKTFRKKTFFILAAVAGIVLFLSAGILIPYWQAMLAGGLYAETATGITFAERSLLPAQVLLPFAGESVYEAGVEITKEYMSLGLPFLVVLFTWGYVGLAGQKEENRQEKKVAYVCIGLALLAVVMATTLFPWEAVQRLHWLPNVLLEHVGYPYRFLVVAVVCLSLAVSLLGKLVLKKGKKAVLVFLLAVTVANVCSGVYLMNALLYTNEQSHSYEADEAHQNAAYLFYISE